MSDLPIPLNQFTPPPETENTEPGPKTQAFENLARDQPETAADLISQTIEGAGDDRQKLDEAYRILASAMHAKLDLPDPTAGYQDWESIKQAYDRKPTDGETLLQQVNHEATYQWNNVFLSVAEYYDMENSSPETQALVKYWKGKTGDARKRSKSDLDNFVAGGVGTLSQMVATQVNEIFKETGQESLLLSPKLKNELTAAMETGDTGKSMAVVGRNMAPGLLIMPLALLMRNKGGIDQAGKMFGVSTMNKLEAANAYGEMMDMVDENGNHMAPDVAKKTAKTIGFINDLIEQDQLATALASFGLGSAAIETVKGSVKKAVQKTLLNGTVGKIAMAASKKAAVRVVGEAAKDVALESAQEGLQELVTAEGEEIAKSIVNDRDGIGLDHATAQEIAERVKNTIVDSALAFSSMGMLRGLAGGYAIDYHNAKAELAEETRTEEAPQAAPAAAFADSKPTQEAAKEPLERTPEGKVYTQTVTKETTTDGATHARALVGSPSTGERYGYADYTIEDDHISVGEIKTVRGVDTRETIEAAINEIAQANPGMPIEFEKPSLTVREIAATMAEQNPRGKEFGVQWYGNEEEKTDQVKNLADFKARLGKVFTHVTPEQIDVMGELVNRRAQRVGVTPDQYIEKRFSPATDELPAQAAETAQSLGIDTARIRGTTVFSDSRAIIYAAKDADFRTLSHEMMHAFFNEVKETGGEDYAAFKAAFGKEDDEWTRDDLENVAYSFEKYLETGATESPKLKTLFEKIADWMVSVYRTLAQKIQVTPEIAEAFDRMFADRESPMAQAAAREEHKRAEIKPNLDDLELFQEEQKQEDAIREQYQGTDKWMKAPNGKDSKLNEKQWCQVRTENFKKWFGDWEKDPENASKVVDENGEPSVVYHGTDKNFSRINMKKGAMGLFWVSSDKGAIERGEVGAAAHGIIMELFANIKNPAGWDEYDNLGLFELESRKYDGAILEDNGNEFTAFVFSPGQVKSAIKNSGDFDEKNPNILFQAEDVEFKDNSGHLMVMHNMTGDDLEKAVKAEGLPMPSIAIMRPEQGFTQFGDISLIGPKEIIDPEQDQNNRVYTRDVWSPTVPAPEYAINKKKLDALNSIFLENRKYSDMSYYVESAGKSDYDTPDRMAEYFSRGTNVQAAYLKEQGVKIPEFHTSPFTADRLEWADTPEIRAAFTAKPEKMPTIQEVKNPAYDPSRPEEKYWNRKTIFNVKDGNGKLYTQAKTLEEANGVLEELSKPSNDPKLSAAIDKAVWDAYVEKMSSKMDASEKKKMLKEGPAGEAGGGIFSSTGEITGHTYYKLEQAVYKSIRGEKPIDMVKTRNWIEKRAPREKVQAWLREKAKDVYSEPFLKSGGKKVPYTAEEMVRKMAAQKDVGAQEGFLGIQNLGKIAAMAAQRLDTVSEIRTAGDTLKSEEDVKKYYTENIEPYDEAFLVTATKNYKYHDASDFTARTDARQALFNYVSQYGFTINKTALAKKLKALDFTGDKTVDAAVELLEAMRDAPTDYLEAKPKRVVALNEFRMAVVPSDTDEKTRSLLADQGLKIYEYKSGDQKNRMDVVKSIAEKEPDILFQASEDELKDIAKEEGNWKDFMGRCEAFGEYENTGDLSQEQKELWYQSEYERLTAPTETSATKNSTEADEYFRKKITSGSGLRDYLYKIGEILTIPRSVGPADEEEARFFNRAGEQEIRMRRDMHPTVIAAALRTMKGEELSEAMKKSVTTLMTKKGAVSEYRRWYAELTEDEGARAAEEAKPRVDIIDKKDKREREGVTIEDRLRLASKVHDEELRRKIRSGELVVGDEIEELIKHQDTESKELSRNIQVLEGEIAENSKTFTLQERKFMQMAEELKTLRADLSKKQNEIDRLAARGEAISDALKDARKESRLALRNMEKVYNETVSSLRKEAKLNATLKAKEKLEAYKARQIEVRARLREKKEIRAYKLKLAGIIMQPPNPKTVLYTRAQEVLAIQSLVDPHFRKATVQWRGMIKKIAELLKEPDFLNDVGYRKELIDKLRKKDLNLWSIAELEDLANLVTDILKKGRKELEAKKLEEKIVRSRKAFEAGNSVFSMGKYEKPKAAGSADRRLQLAKKDNILRTIQLSTYNTARVAQMADGGKQGTNYDLLVTQYRAAREVKMAKVDERVGIVQDKMKELGINPKSLYERITVPGVGPNNSDAKFTKSDLGMFYIGLRNKSSRETLIYGNLMSMEERRSIDMEKALRERQKIMEKAIDDHLSVTEKTLFDTISHDFEANFTRLNQVYIDEFNMATAQEKDYVPILLEDVASSGGEHEKQQAEEVLNVGGVTIKRTPKKGFMVKRIEIAPRNRRAMKLDLMNTWMAAVERQEHFIAFTHYVRDLNAIYKNRDDNSRVLQDALVQSLGPGIKKYIDERINEIANPESFQPQSPGNKFFRAMRGNVGPAALGFRLSSMVTQAVTSPAPYLAYVSPLDLAKSAFEAIQDPKAFDAKVKQSASMRHRSMSPIVDAMRTQQSDNPAMRKINEINQLGMKGLEAMDWAAVSVGWNAVYNATLKNSPLEMEQEEAETIARKRADEVTLECQPSGDSADLSPLFKTNSEAVRIFTQFGAALNVIWQQMTYDVPMAIKNHQFRKAFTLIASYALAGIAIGMIKNNGDNDDDGIQDDLLYWAFTQETDSVPIVGSWVTAAWKKVATGEAGYTGNLARMSFLDELQKSVTHATKEEWAQAGIDLLQAVGYSTGLPVGAAKEVGKIIEYGPAAAVGRQ